jgi:5,6-dimethylbenzimidazole synthase
MDLFEAIYKRRDIRHFKKDAVESSKLIKILDAAHHAGSVGFMQPWKFIVIESQMTKTKVYESFLKCNQEAQAYYSGDRQKLYKSLKLEGILEAPLNLAVTCQHSIESGEPVLGKQSMPEMDVFSTCCAIQNLWLAARAEGLGLGWVSILEPNLVKEVLKIPPEVSLVGYFCLGYPEKFDSEPLLQKVGWRRRLPLREVVFRESWAQAALD